MDFTVITDNFTYFMIGRYPQGALGGVALTLYLALVSCVFALVGGVVLGVASYLPFRPLRGLVRGYTHVMRGVPLLMVIFWMYFLLPLAFKQPVPENWTVIAALTLFTSAYMAHIVRAGIESVPTGQREAALATGLKPWQVMAYVVLPQALRMKFAGFPDDILARRKASRITYSVSISGFDSPYFGSSR